MNKVQMKLILPLLFAFLLNFPAIAQDAYDGQRLLNHHHSYDWDSTKQNVFVEITPKTNLVKGGETIPVVIEQIIRPTWHTYWKNPGDSGEGMRINWRLPTEFTAEDPQWPTPQQQAFPPLMNFGYSHEAMILQNLHIPADIPPGPIDLPVRLDILVCHDICIPESIETTLSFNTGTEIRNAEHIMEATSFLPLTPAAHGWDSTWQQDGDNMVLRVETTIDGANLAQHHIEFFPYEYGLVDNPAAQNVTIKDNGLTLRQKKGDFALERIKNKGGVLVLEHKESGERFGYELAPTLSETAAIIAPPPASTPNNTSTSLVQALFFALIGGMILNLMPCVFPVLSMKALHIAKFSSKNKKTLRQHGLAYTAGIILTFLFIAGLLITLKTGGSSIGWGFHLQNPIIILLLSYLFFCIALNLTGFFEIQGRFMNIGARFQGDGLSGSFFTGVMATIVATPCTAPFMAVALGYALVQPPYIALTIFAALGLGLASPFLLISFVPALQKYLPKPGAWMVTFKELLSFPMFAAVIWLLWILTKQTGMNSAIVSLCGFIAIAFGIWVLKKSKHTILSIAALLILGISTFTTIYTIQALESVKESPVPAYGTPFDSTALDNALNSHSPVFVEMTAAWCVTCKVNHYTSLDIPRTRELINAHNISYLIGDWTNYNAEITEFLNKFGRNGVPLYVYYAPSREAGGIRPEPVILPQILTPSLVADTLTP